MKELKCLAKLYEGKREQRSLHWPWMEDCEVAPKWMDSDPAREGSGMLFSTLFVGQLAPGIRKKLQNREVEGMVISQVMPVRTGKREKRRRRAKRNY